MKFKEWLFNESLGGIPVLMKAVGKEGADSISKGGFKLQPKHQSTINYYNKYGDTDESQMYGPGLYFGLIPKGVDSKEFAEKNCKDYSESWGDHIVLATFKGTARGLITIHDPNHPIWNLCPSGEVRYKYDQLKALGVAELIGYTKNDVHDHEDWGYKLYNKIDFWAHQHNTRQHVVVYNPNCLQIISQFECNTGNKKKVIPPQANQLVAKPNPNELSLEDIPHTQ